MKTYLVTVRLTIIENNFADVEDFRSQLDSFNKSNQDVMKAEVVEISELESEGSPEGD